MDSWTRVKWTEAGQIAELLEWKDDLGDGAKVSPQSYFETLKTGGRLHEAAFFLGVALPRYETVAWAARTVRDLRLKAPTPPSRPDADALKAVLLWVQDPSDVRRRAAYEASKSASTDSAERMAALAAFFSGGSITPEDCPPVPAPNHAAGRFAAGAVVLAAIASGDQSGSLSQALEAGEVIAAKGLNAGAR